MLPQASGSDASELMRQLQRFEAQRREFNERNLPATGAPPFGHGRVDAFAGILNEVTATLLDIPENVRPQRDQPYYHLLAENEQTTYVAYVSEQNLLPDDSGTPCRHLQIDEMFDGPINGTYTLKPRRAN